MSFQDFERSIVSPALKRVVNHWNEARGKNGLTTWSAIKPSAIAAQLPLVWSYNYDRASDAFTGRLSGNSISEIFGRNIKGVPMDELYPISDFQRLFDRTRRVVCEPAFYRGEGMVFIHLDRYGQGERIMMPMASDGTVGDGVFGATEYKSVWGTPKMHQPEAESWFGV
jgi:hypothetical protein